MVVNGSCTVSGVGPNPSLRAQTRAIRRQTIDEIALGGPGDVSVRLEVDENEKLHCDDVGNEADVGRVLTPNSCSNRWQKMTFAYRRDRSYWSKQVTVTILAIMVPFGDKGNGGMRRKAVDSRQEMLSTTMGCLSQVDNSNFFNFQSINAKLRTLTEEGKRYTMV